MLGHKKENDRSINGEKMKLAVVISDRHNDITEKMLEGALEVLAGNNVLEKNVKIVWTGDPFELSLVCQNLARNKKFDGLIVLGCLIKGETDRYHYIAQEVYRAAMNVMLTYSMPLGLGLITADNLEQAIARSFGEKNYGRQAAQAVLEMISRSN